MNRNENNNVVICGSMCGALEFAHESFGERFYTGCLMVKRISDNVDFIPFLVSEKLVDVSKITDGMFLHIAGEFRSFNKAAGNKTRLILSVFTQEIEAFPGTFFENDIELTGHICKETSCRATPNGRVISDLLLAVNRPYSKSDYIPCIAWGREAKYLYRLPVGTKIKLKGRIQSRNYQKKFSETEVEDRVAYEVSVSHLEVVAE